MHLCAAESAAGAASRREDVEVDEPSTAVELGVDGLDLPAATVVDGLHDDVAGDDLWGLGRAPADGDGVAVVPDVELLEWADSNISMRIVVWIDSCSLHGWLLALAGLECSAAVECGRSELRECQFSFGSSSFEEY